MACLHLLVRKTKFNCDSLNYITIIKSYLKLSLLLNVGWVSINYLKYLNTVLMTNPSPSSV